MNTHLVIDIPFSEQTELTPRSRKYVTCLQMVHKVLSQEISESISIHLFNQIGLVAGFIDQHLDELNIQQQKCLLFNYDELFTQLISANHYIIFKHEICNFVEQQKFEFHCEALHLKDLFIFIQHCKDLGIENKLSHFGKRIIEIAIAKQTASSTQNLIQELKSEGEEVIKLLGSLLYVKHGQNSSFSSTLKLLTNLEHILNVADDTLDVASDKKRGIVSTNLGPFHQLKMGKHLVIQIIRTIALYPLKTMYYAPRLTWYYFSKTLR
ncbi:MAG: hypothetical protein COA58_15355 [Bacteroidetes bacterium]|nr:MAG: hypothetical protein COA58_15355 [Bacteroidota bacterium]